MKRSEEAADGSEAKFTAGDIAKQAGLTYRQLNDWGSKNLLPGSEEKPQGKWRRFDLRELFVILVLKELRDQFGISALYLRWVKACMLQEDANHFEAAVKLIGLSGLSVYVLTDFRETFIMDHEFEMQDLWKQGFFHADGPTSFALLNVNPLVNRLLGALKEPTQVEINDEYRKAMSECRAQGQALDSREIQLLELARNPAHTRLEVILKDGEIRQFRVDEELPIDTDLEETRESEAFQTIQILQKDGKTARVTRTLPIKPSV